MLVTRPSATGSSPALNTIGMVDVAALAARPERWPPAAEHERHVIGERTRHALAAAKARGIKLGNPEQAKINWAKAAARAHALRPHIERRIKPGRTSSSAIATDLRHRMAANGFRCRFVRPRSSRPIESKDLIGRITSISPSH